MSPAPPISDRVSHRLDQLAADYLSVTGSQFRHFFCPILYVDEEKELCAGHIINEAFGASNAWTVQRKDVDNFFGSAFESEFVNLRHRGRDLTEAFTDPNLPRRLRPGLIIDGRPVAHYTPQGPIPAGHSKLIVEGPNGDFTVAMKAAPDDLAALEASRWQLVWERDLRIPAVVSTLKAAHLTLFNMLGYRHVFSTGGRFVGNDILGKFVRDCSDLPRAEVQERAKTHFSEFGRLVRPMLNVSETFRGTPDDPAVYVCERGSIAWGLLVMLRTSGTDVHSVLTPVMESPVAVKVFMDFLARDTEETIAMRLAWYRGDRWEASTVAQQIVWPRTGPLDST